MMNDEYNAEPHRPRSGGQRNMRQGGKGRSQGRGGYSRKGRGDDRSRRSHVHPQREGFREERMNQRQSEPDLPEGIDITELDRDVLQDLRVLSKENADRVAKHLVMAADVLDDDPRLALRHARAAKNRAGRIGVVRETNGIVAYRAGEWKEALSELRAARRILGGPGLLAVMADSERGLGRPEKAIEMGRSPEAKELDPDAQVELAIVIAGARHDLGQHDAALATLQQLNPSLDKDDPESARLGYAYADALLAVGRREESRKWFKHVAKIDRLGVTDADDRLRELP